MSTSELSWRKKSPLILNYGIAVGAAAAAIAFNLELDRLWGIAPSVSIFLCAIMFVAWTCGTGPAFLAFALTLSAFDYLFLHPIHSLAMESKDIVRLALFAVAALFVIFMNTEQRKTADSLRRARDQQQETTQKLFELNETLRAENAERQQAEERARQAQKELQLTIDTIPVLAARYRADGFMEFRNRNWRDYTGLSQDNVESHRWGGALHPDDLAMVEREWRAHIATGEAFDLEQRLRRADGEYRWHWVRRVPLRNEIGDVIKWYGVAFDIDDRKRVENALRQSEAELAKARHETQLIIDSVPVLILRHRADGIIDFVNQVGRTYSGRTTTKWTTRTSVITHPDDVPRLEKAWDIALATGEPFETEARLLRADGEYRWFATRREPLRNADGDVIAWYGATYDIEDRKRAETALRASEAQVMEARLELQLMIDTLSALIVTYEPDGRRSFVNQAWQIYTGRTLQEATGEGARTSLIHPDDAARASDAWRTALASGEPLKMELRVRTADGTYRWNIHQRVPRRDDKGNIVKWYSVGVDIEDQRSTENALRESEARLAETQRELRLTIDSIPVMVSTFEADGSRDFVNQYWQDYTGHNQQQATGKGLNTSVYYHPDDVERFDSAWRDAVAKGETLSVDVRTRRADGPYRWYTMRRAPRRDEQGNIVKWYSVGIDIEDKKVAEDALRRSEARLTRAERELRLTLDTIPTLIASYWPNGTRDFVNRAWQRFSGVSQEDAHDRHSAINIHPDHQALSASLWQASLATGEPYEVEERLRRADGEYRWHSVARIPLRDESGNVAKWYSVGHDIEDRKQAERALQRSRAYLAEAQNLSQTGSFAWEIATRDYYWSDQAYQILGFERSVKPSISLVVQRTHPEDRHIIERELDRSAQGVPSHDFEVRLLMPDGQIKLIHLLSHRITYQSGNVEIVGAVMDITEARRSQETLDAAQAALAHASRVATLGEISASIAHEVNQPLAAIVANGQACLRFLNRETPDLNDVRGAVEWIVKDGNRAGEVIRRVRGLLKKADTHKVTLDVNDLIDEVAALLQRELTAQHVTLRLELASALPATFADRVQLQQVIINLIMNGADAMHTITGRPHLLTVRSYQDDAGLVVVAVTDSGIGLADESADRLFDAFFSTKPGGLGIGLSICRSIIGDHGGRLWAVKNAQRPGATFQFALPAFREGLPANLATAKT